MMTLAEKADRLTELLKEVEDTLFARGLLVPAEVPIQKGKLRWGKRGADWLLMWVDENNSAHALVACSLGRRAAAVDQLEALEKEIWNAMATRDSVVDSAIRRADDYLKTLRGAPNGEPPNEGDPKEPKP